MAYRDDCLQRIEEARNEMQGALSTAPGAASLLQAWQRVLERFQGETPPDEDRVWLADRLDDLRVHVHQSPRWLELFGD